VIIEPLKQRARTALLGLLLVASLAGCSLLNADAPIAAATASPTSGYAPLSVRFDASDSSGGAGLDYVWDVGDPGAEGPVHGVEVDHRYDRSGSYNVRLTVIDDAGRRDETWLTIDVLNRPPLASCRFSTDAPLVGETVTFDASGSVDLDGRIVDVLWTFGDGETARGSSVQHVYTTEAVFTVRVTVVDDAGASDSAEHTMTVHVNTGGGGCSGGGGVCL
jgi:PKD repeat protein